MNSVAPETAWIGVGSNEGEKKKNIEAAIEEMGKREEIEVLEVSSLIETHPHGGPEQENFVNGAMKIKTTLSPQELLKVLLSIEDDFDRTREVRWGPRTLDLDILFYGNQIISQENLTIPHPRLEGRYFVLRPLFELDPDLVHPQLKCTIGELFHQLLASPPPYREGWEVE